MLARFGFDFGQSLKIEILAKTRQNLLSGHLQLLLIVVNLSMWKNETFWRGQNTQTHPVVSEQQYQPMRDICPNVWWKGRSIDRCILNIFISLFFSFQIPTSKSSNEPKLFAIQHQQQHQNNNNTRPMSRPKTTTTTFQHKK